MHQISKLLMFLVSSCSCLCAIYWSQVLSREWRCSWCSAGRRCSNYIWVISNFIANWEAPYIKGFTVITLLHGNAFRAIGPLGGNPPATSGFPSQWASSAELWYWMWITPERLKKMELSVICTSWRSCNFTVITITKSWDEANFFVTVW